MAAMDDKCPTIVSFLEQIFGQVTRRPVVVAVSGGQGSGKTTLVKNLAAVLHSEPHNLNVVVFSIDDLYLAYEQQRSLAKVYPENPLVQVRGEPGTHDVELGQSVLNSLLSQRPTKIPFYDKSCHSGAGDRTHVDAWALVEPPFDVVLFEGWCVGFRSLEASEVEKTWRSARDDSSSVIGRHRLEDLLSINQNLQSYDILTNEFDALIHIDTEVLSYIYEWRLEQEHGLITKKGVGMTDSQVKAFVDCYMPAYELYSSRLREGAVSPGRQLQIVIGQDRSTLRVNVV